MNGQDKVFLLISLQFKVMSSNTTPQNYNYKRIFLAFIGLVGFFSAALGIFDFFTNKYSFSYDIISKYNVLDLNTDLSKLDIFYNGENIKQKKESLKVVDIKVQNTGKEGIPTNFYDDNNLPGITVSNGSFAQEPEIIESNDEFLKKGFIVKYATSTITFSKSIFNPGKYLILRVFVLHKNDENPQLKSVGNIVNIKNIEIIDSTNQSKSRSIFNEIFGGASFFIIILRFIVYTILSFFLIVLAVIVSIKVSDQVNIFRRRSFAKEFKKDSKLKDNTAGEKILNEFIKGGLNNLKSIQIVLAKVRDVNSFYKDFINIELPEENKSNTAPFNIYPDKKKFNKFILDLMIEVGVLSVNKNKIILNKKMIEILDEFTEYTSKKFNPIPDYVLHK